MTTERTFNIFLVISSLILFIYTLNLFSKDIYDMEYKELRTTKEGLSDTIFFSSIEKITKKVDSQNISSFKPYFRSAYNGNTDTLSNWMDKMEIRSDSIRVAIGSTLTKKLDLFKEHRKEKITHLKNLKNRFPTKFFVKEKPAVPTVHKK